MNSEHEVQNRMWSGSRWLIHALGRRFVWCQSSTLSISARLCRSLGYLKIMFPHVNTIVALTPVADFPSSPVQITSTSVFVVSCIQVIGLAKTVLKTTFSLKWNEHLWNLNSTYQWSATFRDSAKYRRMVWLNHKKTRWQDVRNPDNSVKVLIEETFFIS